MTFRHRHRHIGICPIATAVCGHMTSLHQALYGVRGQQHHVKHFAILNTLGRIHTTYRFDVHGYARSRKKLDAQLAQ